MSKEATLDEIDIRTLAEFRKVLSDLTELIGQENGILSMPAETLPMAMVTRKEELGERYARLTRAVRGKAAALKAAGELDPVEMEERIRTLIRSVKENQSLLNARKAATAMRVEAVMQALAERERKEAETYGADAKTKGGPSGNAKSVRFQA